MPRDSETTKSDRQLIEETAQRARRTETRVTMIANHLGVDAGGEKPELREDRILIPSRRTSIEDIVAAIPCDASPHDTFDVFCGGDFVATVNR